MKKFLTVLLALSVVFTYTVGSAFALPSDTGSEAGLAAAKAEAVKELEAYPTMSDYDATGQAKVKAIIAEYTDKINGAKKVGNADDDSSAGSVYGFLREAKVKIDRVDKADAVADAKKAAIEKFKDYVYLIDTLEIAGMDNAVKDAKVGYKTYVEFKEAAINMINGAADIEAVAKVLNDCIETADAIYAELNYVEVSQDVIDALVKAIRSKAAFYEVNTKTHSKSLVNAYEAAIEKGVAEAKAVKTYEELYKVADKYLGALVSEAEAVNGNVYVHVRQLSAFEKLSNKTLKVERQIKAVEKVLSTLGNYDYKAVAPEYWAEAEKFYAEANYFVENGAFDTLTKTPGKDTPALRALYYLVNGKSLAVGADDSTNEFNEKVGNVVKAYGKLAPVEVTKATLAKALASYPVDLSVYSEENATAIKALRATGTNLINAAATVKDAQTVYDEYVGKIDAVDTKEAAAFKASVPKFNKTVDAYVNNYKKPNLSADQEVVLNRVVKDIKDDYLNNEKICTDFSDAAIGQLASGFKLKYVTQTGATYSKDLAESHYADKVIPGRDYNAYNKNVVAGIVEEFEKETLVNIKNWTEFFAAYDSVLERVDAIQTKTQEDYVNAISAVEAAVAALGTPVLTLEFKSKLDKADKAMSAYETAKAAFDKLPNGEKAEVTKSLDRTAYDNAKLEYERLVYLDKLGQKAPETVKEVADFTAIANDFLTTVNSYFSAEAKAEIAKIVTDTYAAINAAATDADKAAEAVKGIEKLDAIAVDGSGAAADLADLLAKVKSEAAEYFTKYENAGFTSDATTKIDLVKDIIEFNAQFSDTVEKENAAKIKAVESLKIQVWTKLYTKTNKIRVNWKVKGDASAADGYYVYKSTKAHSNYKYMGKTKKAYMDNKKNLKKGKRYFYKVRAYVVVDGQKYFSDYSNKGNRIYK